jgi:hypothetical protein
MSRSNFSRLPGACLLFAVLMAGPTACSPSVSDMELSTAKTHQEEAEKKKDSVVRELKSLNEEVRALTGGYTGPQYMEKTKKAETLRQEKSELEAIKADVEAKTAHFVSEAKRHRDDLEKEKP